jgi:hypothetical protein
MSFDPPGRFPSRSSALAEAVRASYDDARLGRRPSGFSEHA